MSRLAVILLVVVLALVYSPDSFSNTTQKIPDWCNPILASLGKGYTVASFLHPTILTADFSGDGTSDVALPITGPNGKKGILIINQETNKTFILGAGTSFSNGGDDWTWLLKWKLFKGKQVQETTFDNSGDITGTRKVPIKRTAIQLYENNDGSPSEIAIIYWNGTTYTWIHQGE